MIKEGRSQALSADARKIFQGGENRQVWASPAQPGANARGGWSHTEDEATYTDDEIKVALVEGA
jgi:hypothetical protein